MASAETMRLISEFIEGERLALNQSLVDRAIACYKILTTGLEDTAFVKEFKRRVLASLEKQAPVVVSPGLQRMEEYAAVLEWLAE